MHQLQSLAFHLLYYNTEDFLLFCTILWQKDQPCTVFSFLGYRDALQENKLMRYLNHDTCTISIFTHLGTSVAHVLKHTQGIVNQLVALAAMDVDNHAHTAGIVLILALIKSLFLKFTFCHIILN